MTNLTLFAQILQLIPRDVFRKCVEKYQTNKHNKGIDTWTHFVAMMFCHLGKATSIRDIVFGLRSMTGNANHVGITRKIPSRSSISYINEHRIWHFFRELYFELKVYYQNEPGLLQRKMFHDIPRKIYLLDSTVISVCLKIFDWAVYRQEKGAIKLHTMLDYDGCIPSYVYMTAARQNDQRHAHYMNLPKSSVVVMDRGYQSFEMYRTWADRDIFFVTRLKSNIQHIRVQEFGLPEGEDEHILVDEEIELTEESSKEAYRSTLRRVVVYDAVNKVKIELLTNNFSWTAATVAELYKQRWNIEIFFKELKQHLKIKSFIGINENAMWVQIWTAMIAMLLLKVLKQRAKYGWHLSNLVTFLRINLFVKIGLQRWLDEPFYQPEDAVQQVFQLNLFGKGG